MPMSKKALLVASSKKHARKPNVQRLRDASKPPKPPRTYKPVLVTFYHNELDWLDETAKALKRGGRRRATRSGVLHEAIWRLQQHFKGKSPIEIVEDFRRTEALQDTERAEVAQ